MQGFNLLGPANLGALSTAHLSGRLSCGAILTAAHNRAHPNSGRI